MLIKKIIACIVLFSTGLIAHAQSDKIANKFENIDFLIKKGKYSKATSALTDLTDYMRKKNLISTPDYPLTFIYQARIMHSQLKYTTVDFKIDEGLKLYEKPEFAQTNQAVKAHIMASEIMQFTGNLKKALTLAQKANLHAKGAIQKDSILAIEARLNLMQTQTMCGIFDETTNRLEIIITDIKNKTAYAQNKLSNAQAAKKRNLNQHIDKLKQLKLKAQYVNNLQNVYRGQYKQGNKGTAQLIEDLKNAKLKKSPLMAATMQLKAEALASDYKIKDAGKLFKKAYSMHKKIFGKNHAETVALLANAIKQLSYDEPSPHHKWFETRLIKTKKGSSGLSNNENFLTLYYLSNCWVLSKEGYKEKLSNAQSSLTRYSNAAYVAGGFALDAKEMLFVLDALAGKNLTAQKYLDQINQMSDSLIPPGGLEYAKFKLLKVNYDLTTYSNIPHVEEKLNTYWLNGLKTGLENTHKDYYKYSNTYGNYLELTDNFDNSLEIYKNGQEYISNRFGKEDFRYGNQLVNVARLQEVMGKYTEAQTTITTSLAVIKKDIGTQNLAYINALRQSARLYITMGWYDQARSNLVRASKLSVKTEIEEKNSYLDLASLAYFEGNYLNAKIILDQYYSTITTNKETNSRLLLRPKTLESKIELALGNYINANNASDQAIKIAQKLYGTNSVQFALTNTTRQDIEAALGDFEQATATAKANKAILEEKLGERHMLVAKALTDQAIFEYQINQNADKTSFLLKKAASIIELALGNKHPLYAETLSKIAYLHFKNNKYTLATLNIKNANKIYADKLGSLNVNIADNLMLLGDVQLKTEQIKEGKKSFKKAQKIYKSTFNSLHPKFVQSNSKLAQAEYLKGKKNKALKMLTFNTRADLEFIRKFFPSLSDREKARYWSMIKPDFELYYSIAVQSKANSKKIKRNIYDFTLATKAILLNTSIKIRTSIQNSNNPEVKSLYNEWITLQDKIINYSESDKPKGNKGELLSQDDLIKQSDQIEKELSQLSDLFSKNTLDEVTWEQVQQKLGPQEAAVEIIRFKKYSNAASDSIFYVALILTAETKSAPELVVLNNGKDLEDKFLSFYRNSIKYGKTDKISYEQFWQPIEKYLPPNSKVYFSADGVYNQINPETLMAADGTQVVDKCTLVPISNTKILVKAHTQTQNTAKNAFLIGNPAFNQTSQNQSAGKQLIKDLPGAEMEVTHISKKLKYSGFETETIIGSAATEAKIKGIKNPLVLHIATHGYFLEDLNEGNANLNKLTEIRLTQNPLLRCGLLCTGGGDLLKANNTGNLNLKNGVLTAYEAAKMDLDQTELVVLSACETGLGKLQVGEGVYGLQRAFLIAGANNVIMSLFKVDDKVTQELMELFYDKWLKGYNRREAFLYAKKEIKKSHPNPLYWGSFVMLGL